MTIVVQRKRVVTKRANQNRFLSYEINIFYSSSSFPSPNRQGICGDRAVKPRERRTETTFATNYLPNGNEEKKIHLNKIFMTRTDRNQLETLSDSLGFFGFSLLEKQQPVPLYPPPPPRSLTSSSYLKNFQVSVVGIRVQHQCD